MGRSFYENGRFKDPQKRFITLYAGIKSLHAMLHGEIFLLGILLLEPCISLTYVWETNKYTN
jgi:hypothetical protein